MKGVWVKYRPPLLDRSRHYRLLLFSEFRIVCTYLLHQTSRAFAPSSPRSCTRAVREERIEAVWQQIGGLLAMIHRSTPAAAAVCRHWRHHGGVAARQEHGQLAAWVSQ